MSSPIDPAVIESRKCAIEASYQRQLSLAGRPGYDPQLTMQLKEGSRLAERTEKSRQMDTFENSYGGQIYRNIHFC